MTRIGVVSNFPGHRAAEHENIQRIKAACAKIGMEARVLDVEGQPIDGLPLASPKELDFTIALHFEAPKLFDSHTYYVLWNPIDFYFIWGYQKCCNHVVSYDDYLSCSSDWADEHAHRLEAAKARGEGFTFDPNRQFLNLYHSLSEPIIEPKSMPRKFFYCGINWERTARGRGRFHEIFKSLDRLNIVDLYGPRKLANGVKPWGGFKSYRGEVPFDGVSLIHRASESGIVLALSSDAHKESGLMSNRLFEGCAAGAVVVGDENRWTKQFFGDSVFRVDTTRPNDEVVAELRRIVEWCNSHPAEAEQMAKRSQQIFLQKFELSQSLKTIAEATQKSFSRRSPAPAGAGVHAVVVDVSGVEDISGIKRSLLANQERIDELTFLVFGQTKTGFYEMLLKDPELSPVSGKARILTLKESSSATLWEEISFGLKEALAASRSELWAILPSNEEWFTGHLESVCGAMKGKRIGCAGASFVLVDPSRQGQHDWKTYEHDPAFRANLWLPGNRWFSLGRFVFAREALPSFIEDIKLIKAYAGNLALAEAIARDRAALITKTTSKCRLTVAAKRKKDPLDRFQALLGERLTSLSLDEELRLRSYLSRPRSNPQMIEDFARAPKDIKYFIFNDLMRSTPLPHKFFVVLNRFMDFLDALRKKLKGEPAES